MQKQTISVGKTVCETQFILIKKGLLECKRDIGNQAMSVKAEGRGAAHLGQSFAFRCVAGGLYQAAILAFIFVVGRLFPLSR
jgi:hypothetical protein